MIPVDEAVHATRLWSQPQCKTFMAVMVKKYGVTGLPAQNRMQSMAAAEDGAEMDLSGWVYDWSAIPVEYLDVSDIDTLEGREPPRALLRQYADLFHTER